MSLKLAMQMEEAEHKISSELTFKREDKTSRPVWRRYHEQEPAGICRHGESTAGLPFANEGFRLKFKLGCMRGAYSRTPNL